MRELILELKDVHTSFFTHVGEVKALRGVNLEVEKGKILGIVGESGSGKSVTSLSIMGLLQYPGRVKQGEILFRGKDLLKFSQKEMRKIRGNEISMIFQDPMTSLNPVYKVGDQIIEVIREHEDVSKKQAEEMAIEGLRLVGIPSPEQRIHNYPFEFSGGMRQRALIALALSCKPQLLIADEPTTALDVTIQAQILRLIKELNRNLNMSTILITHDLGVVASLCDRVVVMYGGLVMEDGDAREIYYSPRHPYTMGLIESIPRVRDGKKTRLLPIGGTPPDLLHPPKGCPFSPRCPYVMNICTREQPPYYVEGGHKTMCWLLDPEAPVNPDYEAKKGGVRRER